MEALQRSIAVRAKHAFALVLGRAAVGRSRGDAVRQLADAYRSWASEHPGRYAATVRAPDVGDEDDAAAAGAVLAVVLDVLVGFELVADAAIDATRALRASLHGFVVLEATGGFGMPQDVGRSFRVMVDAYVAGLESGAPLRRRTSSGAT